MKFDTPLLGTSAVQNKISALIIWVHLAEVLTVVSYLTPPGVGPHWKVLAEMLVLDAEISTHWKLVAEMMFGTDKEIGTKAKLVAEMVVGPDVEIATL